MVMQIKLIVVVVVVASVSAFWHFGRKKKTSTSGWLANCMANSLLKVDSPPCLELHSEASSTTLIFFNDAIFYIYTSNTITSSGRKKTIHWRINFSGQWNLSPVSDHPKWKVLVVATGVAAYYENWTTEDLSRRERSLHTICGYIAGVSTKTFVI